MNKNALVVDNDFFFVEFLTELLEERGYQVIKAYDGKEGMQKLEEVAVDLMFADMVMPKVDGWQLIKFVRSKFRTHPFPIIAVSGTIIEQLDELNRIGADYYISKGPMEKMKTQLNGFLDKIESQPFPAADDENVLDMGNIYPRREAAELIESLHFQRAIIESMGLGIVIVDKDARVLSVNTMALRFLDKEASDVLNQKIPTLFRPEQNKTLIMAMKRIAVTPAMEKIAFSVSLNEQPVRFIVSLLQFDGKKVGWIIAMEDTETWNEPA